MNTVTVHNQFHDGMATDIYNGGASEFSVAKHFDVLSYPGRLQPLRGMTTDTANTGIGNIVVGSDGLMYGIGVDYPTNPTLGQLWQRSGYGATDVWQSTPTNPQLSGFGVVYPFLVEFKDGSGNRKMYWASTGKIVTSDITGASSPATQALSFTNIGQGFVHPQYDILYVPYDNLIGTITSNSVTINTAQLTLPVQYQIPCLCAYGNYLAIPAYSANGIGVNGSMLYLWDTTSTTWNENINWGQGQLKVLNNLNGVLIGISASSANYTGSVQDADSILIKEYSGGTQPVVIKELIAQHLAGSSHPTVSINQNVNFIYKNRLYFSININPNDGVSNSYYGLWSIGKNAVNGRYTVNLERVATNGNTETGVLAAAITGDFVSMCHTANGTLTCTINGQTSSSTYGATSVYESVVNPMMGTNRYTRLHPLFQKQLITFAVHTYPLTSGQQVVGKFRVDNTGSSAWTTAFTKTSTTPDSQLTAFEQVKDASGNSFTKGRNFEFRLESTGGAVITGFTYTYEVLKTNLGEKL